MTSSLNPKKTALLFFDMLNRYVKDKSTNQVLPQQEHIVRNAVQLLETARKHDMMVAYAYANHRPDNRTSSKQITDTDVYMNPIPEGEPQRYKPGLFSGSWETQVIEELKPQETDYLIPKYRWSALFQTYFDLALRTRGVDTIIISGLATEVGVASTAYAARDMDYNVVMIEDACNALTPENQIFFMKHVFPRMARVRTTADVIRMINK